MQQRTVQILSILLFLMLALWGITTFIVYIGVPVHQAVLLTDEAKTTVDSACGDTALLCRGWRGFLPFLRFTVSRASPFLWYAVTCLILYGIFIGYRFLRRQSLQREMALRPWHLVLLFLGSLWLLFMALAYGANGELAMRRVIEPIPQVYPGLGDEALLAQRKSYDALKSEGCLTFIGNLSNGNAEVQDLTGFCIQRAFVTRVLAQVLFILLFLFELLVLGSALLRLLRMPPQKPLLEFLFSLGLGICGWIALLWTLAVISSDRYPFYTGSVGWFLFFIIPLALYKHSLAWLRRFLSAHVTVQSRWHDVSVVLFWLLLSYLAFNFLTVVRPFPIGWDDLGSYVNRPRLLVSYGHFISVMPRFQWEFLTSLGFLLFGYQNYFGATASMLINWSEGLLAVLVVFAFANAFLGKRRGLLSALLYYSLPLVGHFSFADMKIDNAVFFIGALAMLAVFVALFPITEAAEKSSEAATFSISTSRSGMRAWLPPAWQYYVLAGIFLGFAFSIKLTSVMVLFAILTVIAGATLHWSAFIGVLFSALLFLIARGGINLPAIIARLFSHPLPAAVTFVQIGCLIIGIVGLTVGMALRFSMLKRAIAAGGILLVSLCLSILPWAVHNAILARTTGLLLDPPNVLVPTISYAGGDTVEDFGQDIRVLPPDLALNPHDPVCTSTSHTEELDRYWGFEKGFRHYLTLPWRTVMNLDSVGYYVTTSPALLLFPLLFMMPFFWLKNGRWLRYLTAATLFILLEWMFTSNGVPWYGVGVFLGLAIGLETLVMRAPDLPNRLLAALLIVFSLTAVFAMRFWQFEQQQNIFEYTIGKVSAEALSARTVTHYDDIAAVVTERHQALKDRPYVYRVGTFIPYFIPRNLEVIGVADHQLGLFTCLNQEKDHALTLKRLKSLGFNSIVFDTNTATIERDVNGTLHKKVQGFIDFLNDATLGLQILVNDIKAGVAFVVIP